jgi:hypothetical protein
MQVLGHEPGIREASRLAMRVAEGSKHHHE